MTEKNGATPVRGLHAKLAEVMAEVGRIPKNGKAPQAMGGFAFVQVGDAADAIRTALGIRRVSMLPSQVDIISENEHETRSGGTMTTQSIRTTWTLTDGETGETAVIQSLGTGADTGDKFSPKAQTNSMKYALLMGFLLSTGDDPELSDSSDRKARRDQTAAAAVERQGIQTRAPRQDPAIDGLIGIAKAVQSGGQDMELRMTPTGQRLAFRLTEGRSGWKVFATDALAELIATNKPAIQDQRVTCWGAFVPRSFDKTVDGKTTTINYNEVALTRLKVGTLDLTAPDVEEAPDDDITEAEMDELFPVSA